VKCYLCEKKQQQTRSSAEANKPGPYHTGNVCTYSSAKTHEVKLQPPIGSLLTEILKM